MLRSAGLVFLLLFLQSLNAGSSSDRGCATTWVEQDFAISAERHPVLWRSAGVEARLVDDRGEPQEGGPYLRVVNHAAPGSGPDFYFAVGESFHTLKPGQSKKLLVEKGWRMEPSMMVRLKSCYCRH
ncbi:MAG TPA: hypothetical protein VE621_02490 [Bryobacteraceae bacterium]|jgi:hypothetical protein|nr:hypothetical protein [Bryobacteraceae bacterium]